MSDTPDITPATSVTDEYAEPDPAVADLVAQVAAATTISQVKDALLAVLDLLQGAG